MIQIIWFHICTFYDFSAFPNANKQQTTTNIHWSLKYVYFDPIRNVKTAKQINKQVAKKAITI